MNSFTKKGIVQKIIIALVCLTLFNFIYPYVVVQAKDIETQNEEAPGGILLSPVIKLATAIGEGIISICQDNILGMGKSSIYIDTGDNFAKKVGGIVGAVIGGAAVVAGAILAPVTFGASTVLIAGGAAAVGGAIAGGSFASSKIPDDFYLPAYKISPQEIFSDQISALSINFINPKTYEENDSINSAKILGEQVSKWYVAIRNVVLVALMVVLLYIGIRIVISSTASEKAKYKENIKDWLIAIIILVFMHYIMAFALMITEYLTDMLNNKNNAIEYALPVDVSDNEELKQYMNEDGNLKYATNLMGEARLRQQLENRDDEGNEINSWNKIGYTIIFLVLVFYTLMFLIIYIKRVIYMAFLTMISPLVALTYPIDKLKDGKSQAFDMWLKEYVFNLLLQPFHLLLYTVLVGSVMGLAEQNMIYAVVAIGFLLPSEKLLRKFFGFEKAGTTGEIMGGAAGGALAMTAINQLGKLGSSAKNKITGKGNSKDDGGSSEENSKIRTADKGNNTDDLLAEGLGGSSQLNGAEQSDETLPLGGERKAEGDDDSYNHGGYKDPRSASQEALDEAIAEGFRPGDKEYDRHKAEVDKYDALANPPLSRMDRIRQTGRKVANSKFGKTVVAGAKTGGRYTGRGLLKIAKKAPGAIGKAYGMATFGTLGVAAGLASSDYSNVLKYGAAGAGVGYATGWKGLGAIAGAGVATGLGAGAIGTAAGTYAGIKAGGVANDPSGVESSVKNFGKNMKDDYMKERYTAEEIRERNNTKADEQFLKDKKAISLYKDKYGKDEYKKAMKDALEYRKHGITDDKTIIKAMNLKSSEDAVSDDDRTSKERIAIAKIASTAKTSKEVDDYGKRLQDNGIADEKIKQVKRTVRKMNE